ncbi:THO complex subunit 5 homolog [Oscarella lobularis]|uniref:THO complex subunit 5 homolog n=1 Tax=Oscarella lobularis TaxID=121494 RepID=UPI0033143C2A
MPPKRRASTKATQQAPPEPKKPKVVPEDVVEPMETDGTPGPSISKEFSNTCQKLEAVLDQVNEIKKKDSPSESDLAECSRNASLHVITLRRLNRAGQVRCKAARDKTIRSRQEIDGLHLQLQNLLYHVMHLQGEIRECRDFKSRDGDILLVGEDEFYRDAPASISCPDETKGNDHKKMLARLHWELEQRKSLTRQLSEADLEKSAVVKDIDTKKAILSSLQPQLDSVMKATLPVQELMSMPFAQMRVQQKLAYHLPEPLYVLFVQLSAYKEALDQEVVVSVEGELEEAKLALSALKSRQTGSESDSDNEQPVHVSGKRKKRRKTIDETLLQKRADLLKLFPLSVRLVVKDQDMTLQIDFQFVMALEIVSAKVDLNTPLGGAVLKSETFLSWLFPDDDGLASPNPANQFKLRKLGIDGDLFASFVNEMGIPYKWAQRLAGLNFSPEKRPFTSTATSSSTIEVLMKEIRTRIGSRIALQEQLNRLDSLELIDIPAEAAHCFPGQVNTDLTGWQVINWDSVSENALTNGWIERGLIKQNDYFFEATFKNGTTEFKTVVSISPQYPSVAPAFIVSKNGVGAGEDCDIKGLEAEVNVHYPELVFSCLPKWLLSLQIKRLMMCFDIYAECESSEREKIYFRVSRGKDRSRPYVYDSEKGIFTQR